MKSSLNPAHNTDLVRELADFLDSQSISRREDQHCDNCGLIMQSEEFHFWLSGTQRTWNIPLPVCPICAQLKFLKSTQLH